MSGRVYEFEGNTVAGSGVARDAREEDGVGKHAEGLGELLTTGPLFEVVRRGYDRLAVDAYVESTEQELQKLRAKLHTVLRRFHAVSDALVEARQRPEDHAGDIVAQARAEADARMANVTALREAATAARDEARRDRARAAAELDAARRTAASVLAEAQAARDEAEATAALRLAALESEMADLRRQRDEARAYLRRLTGQIEQALQSLTAVLPDDARALAPVPEPGREALAG
jgi:colicin import membrane protein